MRAHGHRSQIADSYGSSITAAIGSHLPIIENRILFRTRTHSVALSLVISESRTDRQPPRLLTSLGLVLVPATSLSTINIDG